MDRRVVKIVTSAGAAFNLDLGFKPHLVRVKNATQWAQTSQLIESWWYSGLGAGYYKAASTQAALTDGLLVSEGTSNGFTAYGAEAFSDLQLLIDTGASKVTQAANAVVTSTAHGLATGDIVGFNGITAGMTQLNTLRSKITRIDANSFSCDDIDSTGFTAWNSSEANGLILKVTRQDNAGFGGVTIGSAVCGAASDVLEVEAHWFDNFDSVSA
jgi:hypothetical protein